MSDRVMRTKPMKHGRRLDGKDVIIHGIVKPYLDVMKYGYYRFISPKIFKLDDGILRRVSEWTVELIIETEEE